MKNVIIAVCFLGLLGANSPVYSAGIEGIRKEAGDLKTFSKTEIAAVKVAPLQAGAPAAAEKISNNESDIQIRVLPGSGLTAYVSAQYKSTNPGCNSFTWNDGSPGTTATNIYKEIYEKNGVITIPAKQQSFCGYQLDNSLGNLAFYIPGKANPLKSVPISRFPGQPGVQKVSCTVRPYGGKTVVECDGSINLDQANQAVVEVVLR